MNARSSQPAVADGRAAAALAVARALSGRGFVADALRSWRDAEILASREAALAMEIGLGAVRHAVTIEHLLGRLARFRRERTSPRLRAVLYTATYQIIWMDRVPAFAAVDQGVELARQLVRGRASAMVNAVLRRLTDAIAEHRVPWRRLDSTQVRVSWESACRFNTPVLSEPDGGGDLRGYLAAAAGERPDRYAGLVARYGPERAEAVAWASQAIPVTVFQRNALRISREAFGQSLRADFGESVEFAGDAAFLPAGASVLESPTFASGLAFVQDPTAHAAALAIGAQPGERVLDLCAAPGGKSVVLALQMGNQGEVVACDRDPQRLVRVDENVRRLGLTCIRTRPLTSLADLSGETDLFDAALVDAPCSNTGVIARRPEARLGLTSHKLRSLVQVQGELLRAAASRVRPGGRLVYSTCSLEPEENEQVVAAFLDESPAWGLDIQQTTLPAWGPRPSHWRDGGFFARLRRSETASRGSRIDD
jgi:16S rRNA (cytosine967-C5)-methyltransferase